MPECTKAERELLEAAFRWATGDGMASNMIDLADAVSAERREAEQGSVVAEQEATIVLTLTDWREQERLLKARIAELEAALAEECAKPKEGAVRFVVQEDPHTGRCHVVKRSLEWLGCGSTSSFTGPDAERHAREHTAKLQAEWSAKSPTDDAKGVE